MSLVALSVGGAGFKTARVPFQIAVNQTLTQNLTLDVGAVNEAVTVTAEAPLLQPSTTNLGRAEVSHEWTRINTNS